MHTSSIAAAAVALLGLAGGCSRERPGPASGAAASDPAVLAAPASGPSERLDRWLAALPASAETVVVVPRLGAVAGPLADGARRLLSHAGIARGIAPLLAEAGDRLGFGVLDLKAHAAHGLDLEGPLLLGGGPDGVQVVVVPLRDEAAVVGWFARVTDTAADREPGSDPPAWRFPEGRGVFRDGALLLTRRAEDLAPLLEGRPVAPVRFADCPRGPGEADLYVVMRPAEALGVPGVLRRGCYTVRFDPDRARLDARLAPHAADVMAGFLPAGDGRPLRFAGGDVAALFALQLGPHALATLRAGARERDPAGAAARLASAFDGTVLAAAGPGPTDLTLALGVGTGVPLDPLLDPAVVRLPPGLALAREAPERWRADWTAPPDWPRDLPRVEAAWLGSRDGFLYATTGQAATRRPETDLATALRARRSGLDPALFDGAALMFHARLGGTPGSAAGWVDRLAAAARSLGLESDGEAGLEEALAGVLYVLAHVAEVGLAARTSPAGVHVALEVSTL